MRWGRVWLCLLVAAGMLTWCMPMSGYMAQRHIKHLYQKQVEALETQWRIAQVNGDIPTLERLLADDYIGITANGTVQTKDEALAAIRNKTFALSKIDLSEVKARIHGDTAVVTSKAQVEGTLDGVDMSGTYRYTRVYVRKLGTWQITNFEVTRIVTPKAEN